MKYPDWVKNLAIPIADRLVYASSAYTNIKSTLNALSDDLIDFQQPPKGDADTRLRDFAQLVRPMSASNLRLTRIGNASDGGYVMSDDLQADGAISLGIGPDVSWDCDVSSLGIPVVMFDPTIRRPPKRVEGAHFFRLGVGETDAAARMLPLGDLIQVAGFEHSRQLLLKMDVEGAEWVSISNASSELLSRFRQIVVEFHDISRFKSDDDSSTMLSAAALLSRHHVPVHVHANNYSEIVRFDDYWFPDAIEVTYVRNDLLVNVYPADSLSTELDGRSDVRTAEISLVGLLNL